MRRRGHLEATIRKVSFDNPLEFLSQTGRFKTEVQPTR
ncbi:MAG: metal-dependent hydrolase, partial [Phycisphaeraceae bacterium]|nr:metal-dependent hydrolase [Phycisphaeraceae bacterium]